MQTSLTTTGDFRIPNAPLQRSPQQRLALLLRRPAELRGRQERIRQEHAGQSAREVLRAAVGRDIHRRAEAIDNGGDSSFNGKGPALAREARAVDRRATVGKCIMTKWKIKPGVD